MRKNETSGKCKPTLAKLVMTPGGKRALRDLTNLWMQRKVSDASVVEEKLTEVIESTQVVIPTRKKDRRSSRRPRR